MIDFRTSGIFAGAAFILSLALGIFSGAAFPMLILRPFIFALIFFGIAALGKHLIEKFIPDLLNQESAAARPASGRRVNITEDFSAETDSEDYLSGSSTSFTPRPSPLFEAALPKPTAVGMGDGQEGLGNISDLLRKRAERASMPVEQSKAQSAPPPPPPPPMADLSMDGLPMEELPSDDSAVSDAMEGLPSADTAGNDVMENLPIANDEKSSYNEEGELSTAQGLDEIPMWDFDKGVAEPPAAKPALDFKPGGPQGVPGASVDVYESKVESKAEPAFTNDFPRDFPREFPQGNAKSTESSGGDAEILPDLDSMAGAFKQTSKEDEQEAVDYNVPSSSASSRGLPRTSEATWAGNFNPKDIAMGLQTILTKEKEG